jgi:hypothetical protein
LDDLSATAIIVSDGDTRVAILSCDLLHIHPDLVRRVRRDAGERTGIPAENMMFCATHTHSGPATYAYPDSPPIGRAYVANLTFQLVGLIEVAHHRLAPARFGFGRGQAHIGVNRRVTGPGGTTVIDANPDGPTDPGVDVLRIDRDDGTPLAVLVNHACHAVVLGAGSTLISPDWPGKMREVVEEVTGAACLFIQGAAADINPLPGIPCDRLEVMEKLGIEVGAGAIAAWAGINARSIESVGVCSERASVPLISPARYVDRPLVEMAGPDQQQTRAQLRQQLRHSAPWTADLGGTGDKRDVAVEVQAIRIGDMALVSVAGEVFVETGLRVKQLSAIPKTMFAAYTNGCAGYLPPAAEYARGGYEVDESFLFYQLPTPVAPGGAALVEQSALRLLSELAHGT